MQAACTQHETGKNAQSRCSLCDGHAGGMGGRAKASSHANRMPRGTKAGGVADEHILGYLRPRSKRRLPVDATIYGLSFYRTQ